jgi:hypothetical protein
MKPQPDFPKLFFEYFGTKPRKVLYEIRQGPCRFHDLVFLNSLIHDATFHRKDARLSSERLTIPVDRDCWELLALKNKFLTIKNEKEVREVDFLPHVVYNLLQIGGEPL